jgi:hypothetical protein
MRWWLVSLVAIGLSHGAAAGELNSKILRGSIGSTYRVIQTPAQDSYLAGSTGYEPTYEVIQSPAHERYAAPHRSVRAGPTAPVWTGFYIGTHVDAGAGTADIADPFGSSIFGDKIPTPGFLAGG